ncbi:MAG: DUF438 domain-containing protein [Candidatus Brockarchaeota archaeon]|nr:DUF438 domain-containing protein [Candidatus Brockarchaeota archaeon]MBO3809521.1 DUF438 domain-containing protein [Candidatus Brockarchaeota archaeon]
MSTEKRDREEKTRAVREILKELHRGGDIEEISRRFGNILSRVSPTEIPLIEQQLVKEGVSVEEILKLCDLHVALFRKHLQPRELEGVPKGHPLDALMKENDWILKQSETIELYASILLKVENEKQSKEVFTRLKAAVSELLKIGLHYRKIQMLLFPYLEKRGISAVPRVLWGREDQLRIKLRQLSEVMQKAEEAFNPQLVNQAVNKAVEIAREASELVFRENKILFPAAYALLSEGEWAAIAEISKDLGYIVGVEEEWRTDAKPILPYELEAKITSEQMDRLPPEFRSMVTFNGIEPDVYRVPGIEDIDLNTGFLNVEEIKAVFKSLPLEVTFANKNDRIKFFTESILHKGFARAKTIIGRRVEYCHPPRLESIVRKNIDDVKLGVAEYREYWTRSGGRIIRVLIVPVRNENRDYLGSIEIVEDLTEVVDNPDEVKRRIMVL